MWIYVLSILSFVMCVYAYITGVKHGLSVGKARVPSPIKDVLEVAKSALKPIENEADPMNKVLSYSYEEALEAVKKEHTGGVR